MNAAALRGPLAAVGVVALVAGAAQAPRLLRRLDAFRVDQVEVLGTHYLAPNEALARSGITYASSVFDDPAPWRAALLAHPLVAAVEIERRLPGTIVLTIEEVPPVALARTPELRPVDAAGRVLPIDPAFAELDLPVLAIESAVGADGRLADSTARALVAAADRLRRLEPAVARRVSEIAPGSGDGVRLRLREPAGTEVLIPPAPEPLRLARLRVTIADLSARSELAEARRIDVRFRDQVVVSFDSQR